MGSVNRLYTETPVVFGRDRSLVGVTCRPAAASAGKPFVLFLNAGIIHSPGPNRMNVRLARALAHVGVSSLRFDLSGIGDSIVPPGAVAMPIQERVRIDIDDALSFAKEQDDAERFVVGGLCSGADNALRTAARRDDVVGVFLLDLNVTRTRGYWLRHYARRVLRREGWVNLLSGRNPTVRAWLDRRRTVEAPVDAGVPADGAVALPHDAVIPHGEMREMLHRVVASELSLLCVFTAGVAAQYNYARQFLDLFPEINFADRLRLHYFRDADHTFSGSALQERLRRAVVGWVSETAFRGDAALSGPAEPARAPRYSLTPRSRLRRPGMQPVSGSSGIGRGR
jgi:hypothetical protein